MIFQVVDLNNELNIVDKVLNYTFNIYKYFIDI